MTEDIDELAQTIAKTCKTQEDFTEFFKQLKRRVGWALAQQSCESVRNSV